MAKTETVQTRVESEFERDAEKIAVDLIPLESFFNSPEHASVVQHQNTSSHLGASRQQYLLRAIGLASFGNG